MPHTPSRGAQTGGTGKRLLALSLSLNMLGVLAGGLYVYKTKEVLIEWYERKFMPKVEKSAAPSPQARYHRQRLAAFKLLQERSPDQQVIIFAGDSLVQTFGWGEYFERLGLEAPIANRGINGDTIDQLRSRSKETLAEDRLVERMFVMVGVNDINAHAKEEGFRPEQIVDKYVELLEIIAKVVDPAKVCVHGILPVRDRYAHLNPVIRRVNGSLERYLGRNGYCYIDLYEAFADDAGELRREFAFEDGLHLSTEGYRAWTASLEPYLLPERAGGLVGRLRGERPRLTRG